MKSLDAAETAMRKQALISAMNENQINEYAVLTKQIGSSCFILCVLIHS